MTAGREVLDASVTIAWSTPTMDGLPPSARGGHTTLLAGQRIVVFGGHYFGGEGSFVYLNDTHVLDLETSTWCQVKCEGKPPAPRYNHTATLIGTKMFVFGGKGAKGALYRDMFYLDLETWHWFRVNWTTESPSERFGHADLAVGNKLVVFGGWDGTGRTFKDLWVFDTESFAWIKPKVTGTPPTPRHGHTMVLLEDGRILVLGGYALKVSTGDISGEYFNDVYTLDTETMVWTRPRTTGDFPLGTFGHTASVFDGHTLYVVGGWSGTERSPIYLGDKPLQETAKALAREQRLQSGSDVRTKSFKADLAKSKYVHVLDCATMEWSSPQGTGVPVPNRYGHTCTVVGPHLFVFGGWDGNRALHQLVVADLPTSNS